jgi:molybdopterin-guanine dinucleotide biosynthesis protein A
MMKIAAAILAGGRGERLGGVNKAMIELGERTLLDHAMASVEGCDPIVLSTGANSFPDDVGVAPERRIADLESGYGGPLAGVAAAVDVLARIGAPDLLLTLAVDTPFFPRDFAERAYPMSDGVDVVVAAFREQDYPTNCLWRFGALGTLPAAVREGTAPHSLKRLIASCRVAHLDYARFAAVDPFANANTRDELEALRARLVASG